MRVLFLALGLVVLGCNGSASNAATAAAPAQSATVARAISAEGNAPGIPILTGTMQRTASGLAYIDERPGEGAAPQAGQTVSVHYTGWLSTGKQFDTSRGGQPLSFAIGRGTVIKGWDEGLGTMKVGGKRRLIIPAALGYGRAGFPPVIPGDATLIFDVELVAVR
jgi:peptidylprolyl isomerase